MVPSRTSDTVRASASTDIEEVTEELEVLSKCPSQKAKSLNCYFDTSNTSVTES